MSLGIERDKADHLIGLQKYSCGRRGSQQGALAAGAIDQYPLLAASHLPQNQVVGVQQHDPERDEQNNRQDTVGRQAHPTGLGAESQAKQQDHEPQQDRLDNSDHAQTPKPPHRRVPDNTLVSLENQERDRARQNRGEDNL